MNRRELLKLIAASPLAGLLGGEEAEAVDPVPELTKAIESLDVAPSDAVGGYVFPPGIMPDTIGTLRIYDGTKLIQQARVSEVNLRRDPIEQMSFGPERMYEPGLHYVELECYSVDDAAMSLMGSGPYAFRVEIDKNMPPNFPHRLDWYGYVTVMDLSTQDGVLGGAISLISVPAGEITYTA